MTVVPCRFDVRWRNVNEYLELWQLSPATRGELKGWGDDCSARQIAALISLDRPDFDEAYQPRVEKIPVRLGRPPMRVLGGLP